MNQKRKACNFILILFNTTLLSTDPVHDHQTRATGSVSNTGFNLCHMTKLSVNINKLATLRNSRGGNNPNIVQAAIDAQRFGADGITVHPRPDERHIRYHDVREIKKIIPIAIGTEFNIEGNPTEKKFIDLVLEVKLDRVTLVPATL